MYMCICKWKCLCSCTCMCLRRRMSIRLCIFVRRCRICVWIWIRTGICMRLVWEEGHNLTHAKCVQPTFLASHLTHVSYQPDSAEPIDVGKRRVGRPRQQWLFRFKVIIHNQISPTDYDGDPFQNNKDSTGSGTKGKRKIGICIRICTYVEVHVCVYV